jgi:hypothetical protein
MSHGASPVEEHHVELAKALGVGDQVEDREWG